MKMRKSLNILFAIVFIFLTAFSSIQVKAEGDIPFSTESSAISGQVMAIDSAADALKKPEQGAEVGASFNAGDPIFVTNETDEWYEIFYKGDTLYINKAVVANQASNDQQVQELGEEFEQKERMDKTYVESYVEQRQRAKKSLIFKIIIAVLIVGIIAASVVIGIRNAKLQKDTTEMTDGENSNEVDHSDSVL